jgi:hypothetical protein
MSIIHTRVYSVEPFNNWTYLTQTRDIDLESGERMCSKGKM